ncbi:MAG TPA: hypothetical protein VFP44_06830 [Usitatibacter sp.]|nr:hypothetical protein [Usitatibacter sp.]
MLELEPEEPDALPELVPEAPPELAPDEPLSPPPQSLAANCGSVGFSVAHFEERPLWLFEDNELFDDLLLPAVLASLLLLEPVDVPAPDIEPEPPSLLVVPVEPLVLLPAVPVLLVPVLLPLSDEPLEVPAVEPFIEELLLDGEELIELLLDGDVLLLP